MDPEKLQEFCLHQLQDPDIKGQRLFPILGQKKLKEKEVRAFHTQSPERWKQKGDFFCVSSCLEVQKKKVLLAFFLFRQRLLYFQCCETEDRRKQIYFAYTAVPTRKKKSHKSLYKYVHVPKTDAPIKALFEVVSSWEPTWTLCLLSRTILLRVITRAETK